MSDKIVNYLCRTEILHIVSHVTTQCQWSVAKAYSVVEPPPQILPNLVFVPVHLKCKGRYRHIRLVRKGGNRFGYGTCLHRLFTTHAECSIDFVTHLW